MATRRKMTKVSRDVLEATAQILGSASAASKALADADTHEGVTNFFRYGNTIIVQKVATPAATSS